MKMHNTLHTGLGTLAIIAIIAIIAVGGFVYTSSEKKDKMMEEGEKEMMMKEGEMMKEEGAMDKEVKEMMKEAEMMKKDEMMKEMDGEMMKKMMAMPFMFSGDLLDVTEGKDVRGLNTGGLASGVAKSDFTDGEYNLYVTFENLPAPQGDDFYEGWIVRTGANFSVMSSGKLDLVDGVYTNSYSSAEDLTDHAFYVLTIEPNDGDPAPADHILEGTMVK